MTTFKRAERPMSQEEREIVSSIKEIDERLEVLDARKDINSFMEYVIVDEDTGEKLNQAAIHRSWHEHIEECRKRGKYAGILSPWGHGKTSQCCIGKLLDEVGKNQNLRSIILCNSDDNGILRLNAISKYMKDSPRYKKVYPKVRPANIGEWSKHRIFVERPVISKDPTIEAYGITSTGIGSRCKLMIVDDPVDYKNAIQFPTMRESIKNTFKNTWLSRLTSDGFVIYIATIWHREDLSSDLLKNKRFSFLIQSISKDMTHIVCKKNDETWTIPLWNRWNKEKLALKLEEVKHRAFDRGFRNTAISDEDRIFKSFNKCKKLDLKISDARELTKNQTKITGVDLSGKNRRGISIFTIAYDSVTNKKTLIDLRVGQWSSPDTAKQILDVYQTYSPISIFVENNSYQEALIDWTKLATNNSLPIEAFHTGNNKNDEFIGVVALETEFANGQWVFPFGDGHDSDCNCVLCAMATEFDSYPGGDSSDIVMSAWFAKEGLRKLEVPKIRFI